MIYITCELHLVLDRLRAIVQLHQAMMRQAKQLATCWNRESDSKPGYAHFAVISQEPGS